VCPKLTDCPAPDVCEKNVSILLFSEVHEQPDLCNRKALQSLFNRHKVQNQWMSLEGVQSDGTETAETAQKIKLII